MRRENRRQRGKRFVSRGDERDCGGLRKRRAGAAEIAGDPPGAREKLSGRCGPRRKKGPPWDPAAAKMRAGRKPALTEEQQSACQPEKAGRATDGPERPQV